MPQSLVTRQKFWVLCGQTQSGLRSELGKESVDNPHQAGEVSRVAMGRNLSLERSLNFLNRVEVRTIFGQKQKLDLWVFGQPAPHHLS
jgi:hypothetical protein